MKTSINKELEKTRGLRELNQGDSLKNPIQPSNPCGQRPVVQRLLGALLLGSLALGQTACSSGSGGSGGTTAPPVVVVSSTGPTLMPSTSPTNSSSATIRGTALRDGSQIRIEGGLQTVEMASAADRSFAVPVNLRLNGSSRLFVTELFMDGTLSPVVGLEIIHDGTAPSLFIDFPPDNAQLTVASTDVAGRVGDLLSGFAGLEVSVNGVNAVVDVGIGTNGTFLAQNVPLTAGVPTMIQASAMDSLGNMVTKSISVTRVSIAPGQAFMTVQSGNGQTAAVETDLSSKLAVKMVQGDGTPFAGKVVTFQVDRSNGLLGDGTSAGGLMYQAITDAAGIAQASWTLGSDAGCGNNRVAVTSMNIAGTIFFCASATPGMAAQINVGSGNLQRAVIQGPLAQPLRAWVSDACNGVEGVPVSFSVVQGNGKLNGLDSVTVTTGPTGHAEVDFVLGDMPGNNVVLANFMGNTGGPATFAALGIVRDMTQPTSFSGVVLSNGDQPIEGAVCILTVGSLTPQIAPTDAAGFFNFDDTLGSGLAHLTIDGAAATGLGGLSIPMGSFPGLAYEVVLVPNAENSRPTPILLPSMDPANNRSYDGSQDVQLTVEGMEGLMMTVKAGSVTLADGTIPSAANPVTLALNQVQASDVPMPMPDGNAPPFAWTLQPSGTLFDPPVEISYPNMSGLAPGSIAYFLSFNHETNRFEIIGSGQVSDDGASIISDPGVGISVAGWGCNCPPYSVTEDCKNCNVKVTGMEVTCKDNLTTYSAKISGDGVLTWKTIGGTAMPNSATQNVSDGDVATFSTKFSMPGPGGTSLVEATLVCDDGSLRDLHGVKVKVADVGFEKSPSQNYGYDELAGMADEYVSLSKTGTTKVVVTANPDGMNLFAVSSDKQVFDVPGGKVALSGASTEVMLIGTAFAEGHKSAKLQIVLEDESGPTCGELNVEVYKELVVPQIFFYRIKDSTVAATTPAKTPSFASLKTAMNGIYKQAVINVAAVAGNADQDLRFDLNNNGVLDFYNDGANPELAVITGANLMGANKIAYLETIRDNWRLGAAAAAMQNKVTLVSVAGIGLGSFQIGPPMGAAETVRVTAIDAATNTLTLGANLASAHAVSDTLYGGLAGLSSDPQLVTDAGGELIITIVHEIMHRMVFGGLADVAETDNVMYFTTGGTGASMLRFRGQTAVDTGTGVPTGAKENQWNKVAR